MPFHGDDPLLTRAYTASTLLPPSLGTYTSTKRVRAHLKRNVHTRYSVTERCYATVLTNVHAIRYTGSVSIRLARYSSRAGRGLTAHTVAHRRMRQRQWISCEQNRGNAATFVARSWPNNDVRVFAQARRFKAPRLRERKRSPVAGRARDELRRRIVSS